MKIRSISSIILLMIFSCVLMMNGDVFVKGNNEVVSNEITDGDWYSKTMKNIEDSEYFITYNDNTNTYESPNRKNNLRFHYTNNGFTVEARDNDNEWSIGIYLLSYGRENLKDYTCGTLTVDKNTGIVENEDITIEYINNNKGMRENFIVHKKINGEGLLELHLSITGDADYEVSNNGILFKKDNEKLMEYKDLYVYDSNNKKLESEFKRTENGVEILVNDIDAVYPITIDPLSTTADWMGEGNQADAQYGFSVSSAGDVNGDGYSDIIVGAPAYDNGETDEGTVFVYYGDSTGLSLIADWTGESNQENANYGYSVSSAGDVNGDGYSDIIVGAYLYDNVESNEGAAFVYYGSSSGLSATADWTGESNQLGAWYGVSVSSAGDVNGDGYSDIIVGAYLYDNVESTEGAAFVYYGDSTGLSLTADWTGESNQADACYGISVSSAGDVNGDGYDDIIVGAYFYDNGEGDEGAAFVYYGSSAGLSTTADWMGESNQISAVYGYSVSSAGDVNGDGYSDIIIGAYYYDNGEKSEGAAYLYYGSSSGPSTIVDWINESNQAGAYYGRNVSSAGDVNGDGYSDIIIGANRFDNGELNEGVVFLYYGSSSGPSLAADWTGEENQVGSFYGVSVSSAGDVNGDGYYDIIVGADGYDNGEIQEGAAFVYYFLGPKIEVNFNPYNFGNIDINKSYSINDLIITNSGYDILNIDSMKINSAYFAIDSNYIYPLNVDTTQSLSIKLRALSSDTGVFTNRLEIYYGIKIDTLVEITARFGVPTIIDSAKADDGINEIPGIDDDDFVYLFFNQRTNGFNINAINIESVLNLSNGHHWVDGFGKIDTAYWDSSQTILKIQLSTENFNPTISVGDTIYPDSSSIIGTLNSFVCHYPVVLSGSFGTTGITDNHINIKSGTGLTISLSKIKYSVESDNNMIKIYDIIGKLMYKRENKKTGTYNINRNDFPSGIYFIQLYDNDKVIQQKMVNIQ